MVILVGLFMSLVGALSPEGLFASQETPRDPLGLPAGLMQEETLATVRVDEKTAFARIPILWAEVDGKRVVEDAWGTGEVRELRFKVGVKDVEGTALMVGERQVPLNPTDVLTVRMFKGDFSFRGIGTSQATLQLQGEVKTTSLTKGASGNRLLTQAGESGDASGPGGVPANGRVAYVVLTTGERLDTVAVEDGGARFYTEEVTDAAKARAEPGNLLAKWVRIDGKIVREYTWGEGTLGSIEFEAAEGGDAVVVAYEGQPVQLRPGTRVTVKDFVGEYLVYQVQGGQVRLRLDGYAGDYMEGQVAPATVATSGPGAPVAAFEFSPSNPKSTDVVRFRDLSSDAGEIVLRQWDFGDGTLDVRRDPTHRFEKPGVYEVTLNVTNLDVRTSVVKRTITVRNAEPAADFDFAPRRIHSGGMVAFTDLSRDLDGTVVNWTWDFGDGEISFSRHPVHRFSKGGNLTVTLTTVDDLGGVSKTTKTLVVLNTPPNARFHFAPGSPISHAPVQFSDNSTDADGRIVSWEWTFGEEGKATGPTPTHVFLRPGPTVVTLTVTDDGGAQSSVAQTVVVENQPPRADFLWSPLGAPASTPVEFRSASGDLDGQILSTSWDFGDGSQIGRGDVVSHFFPRAGTYNVTVTVTDNLLATSSVTRSVTIANAAPLADFSMTPSPTFRGVLVTFADLSRDPDGDPITWRRWDFGDNTGTIENVNVVTHTYDRLGFFPVTLRVKDDKGHESFAKREIQVLNRLPTGAFTWEPAIPIANRPVWFNATGVDADSPGELTFLWRFSDGSTDTGPSVSRTFTRAGPQSATLVVMDSEGGRSGPITRNFDVQVAPPIPAFTWSPIIPATEGEVNFTDRSTSPNGAIVSWLWTVPKLNLESTVQNASFTFLENGTFMVGLRVEDVNQAVEYVFHNVTVNARPVAFFDTPTGLLPINEPISFTDHSADPDGGALSYSWNFGDGTPPVSQRGNVSHVYTQPGPKTVTLTVTDDQGASHTATRAITLANRRPVARWDYSPAEPRAGVPVAFTSTGRAFDPDGPEQLKGWTWTFGDGAGSSQPDPIHTFARSGLYTVNLQVTDGLLKSHVEPGSYRILRVGAPHPVTVTVMGQYPDGRPAPILESRFAMTTTFGQAGSGFREIPKTAYVPNGSALDLTFDEGSWLAGDMITVTLRDPAFMPFPLEKMATFLETDGITTSVRILFEIPLPLEATLRTEPGRDALTLLSASPFRNGTQTGHGEVIYRSAAERFHGTGRVTFTDGVPVNGASVTVYARYVPTTAMRTLQDALDLRNGGLGLLGWCKAASVPTNATGEYAWTFSGTDCLSNVAGVYPLGRWEVQAYATYRWATPDESPTYAIWVDPTGGDLASIPLP